MGGGGQELVSFLRNACRLGGRAISPWEALCFLISKAIETQRVPQFKGCNKISSPSFLDDEVMESRELLVVFLLRS